MDLYMYHFYSLFVEADCYGEVVRVIDFLVRMSFYDPLMSGI